MNYQLVYDSIVEYAREQDRTKQGGYFERHHVVPRSLGGTDHRSNLVLLTAKEHFICHLLLTRIHRGQGESYAKMLHAFMLMKGGNASQQRIVGFMYERLKNEYSELMRQKRKGTTMSHQQKAKISSSLKGHIISKETRQLLSEKAKVRPRKPWSAEYRLKMSQVMKIRNRYAK